MVWIVRPGPEVLLLRRPDRRGGGEHPVTGKADKHELPAACAEREAFEETGLRGHLVDLEFCHRYEHKQRQVEEYAFLLRVPRGSEPNISNEHVSARWAGPKEALKVLEWEAHREALARALKALQHGG
ncbi:MAG TPA: NUDIX domain-containing protein [Myxococcales bacterium]